MSTTLQDVANLLDFTNKGKNTDKAVYGEVKAINPDKTYQVSLNGSDTTVKCARLSGAKVGDTVLVEVLSNGYAVVTGTVGGDTDASDAQRSAAAAQEAAGEAQTAASAAQTSAQAAETAANQAVQDAAAASTAAATADSKATAAGTAAAAAQTSADQAAAAASTADSKATAASAAASRAETSATEAKTSASNASEYAARALGNLSTVESVTETLNWITQHGTMKLTTDTALDPTHVYFVQDNDGDYTVGGVKYAVVTEPDVADIATYYELSIDQSLNNYVATHIAVDGEGLWIIPDAGGNKVLIATGQGSTYSSAGTYIIGQVSGADAVLASFLADGATVGYLSAEHFEIDTNGQRFYASDMNGNLLEIANIGFDNLRITPYYSFGTRAAGSRIGRVSFAEGASITASGEASHAEGVQTVASGDYSHAEGHQTTASGYVSHAEGGTDGVTRVVASGDYSHAEGYGTEASGEYAHVQNHHTEAGYRAQTAIGKYNDNQSNTVFEIGNGTSDTARSNAFDVNWNGETRLALDTTATTGVDKTLTDAISALGWTSDVIE